VRCTINVNWLDPEHHLWDYWLTMIYTHGRQTSVVTILDSSSMNPHEHVRCWLGEGVQEYNQAHRVTHHRKGSQNPLKP
jgi:hypothetical protein